MKDIAKFTELFPRLTPEQISYIYGMPKRCKLDRAVDCLMEGPSLLSLCRITSSKYLEVPPTESPHVCVDRDDEEDDLVLAFYKDSKFNVNAYVRISMSHQPGIDTGGLHRQYVSVVFDNIALSKTLAIFEAPQDHL